jgi:RHS repeat-associated protein
MARFAVGLSLFLLVVSFTFAQNDPAAGIQLFSTNNFGVDLASSNVNVVIPGRSKIGKLPFLSAFVGNYHVYQSGSQWSVSSILGMGMFVSGFATLSGTVVGSFSPCSREEENISIVDMTGAAHPVNGAWIGLCSGVNQNNGSWTASDGSGYTLAVVNGVATVYDRAGVNNLMTCNSSTGCFSSPLSATVSDPDGATITWNGSSWLDSLNTTAITESWNGGTNSMVYSYQDAGGNAVNFALNYANTDYNFYSNFGCTGLSEYNWKGEPVVSLTTPTGGVYTLTYEYTGRLAGISFPSGGSVTYSYSGGTNGINCNSGVVPTLAVTVSDPVNSVSGTWTYVNSNNSSNPGNFTVVETGPPDPSNGNVENQTVHYFSGEYQTQELDYEGGCPTSTSGCKGGGTLLRTTTTCYGSNGSTPPVPPYCTSPSVIPSLPITETDVYMSIGNTQPNRVKTTYDSYGDVTNVYQYDFGASAAILQTSIAYGTWNGTSCVGIGSHIYNRPCSIWKGTPGGAGNLSTLIINNGTGHPTQVTRWTNSNTPSLVTNYTYTAGVLSAITDANGGVTNFGNFQCNGMLPGSTTYAVSAVGTSYQTWDCNGGVITSNQDVNGNTTNYCYNNSGVCSAAPAADPLYRLGQIIYPDSTSDTRTFAYSTKSSFPWTITETTATTSSSNAVHTDYLDGLGRTYATYDTDPNNASTGTRYQWFWYNALGQLYKETGPYFSSSDPSHTPTLYNFDALGRVATVGSTSHAITLPTGATEDIWFGSNVKVVSDASGIERGYQYDGLGRLVYVCDGMGAGNQQDYIEGGSTGFPYNCGLNYAGLANGFLTTYTYDPVNDLTGVNINGQTRSFTWDGIGRMLTATTPESGTVTNVYDTGSPGDLFTTTYPAPNSLTGTLTACYGNWSNGACTSTGWDLMHRLNYISFSDRSSTYGYTYDSSSVWGTTLHNAKGRLVLANHNPGGATIFDHDKMGNVVNTWSCTPLNCSTSSYAFTYNYNDYIGVVSSFTDAAGITYTNTLNSIGQTTAITSSKTGTGYPSTLYSGVNYNPFGEVVGATYGDGIVRANTYDAMGRVTEIQDGPTASPTYRAYLSYYGNGSVHTFNDTVSGSYTFTYDAFNRLASSSNATTGQQYTWTYDEFGNRWQQNLVAGMGIPINNTYDTKNPPSSHNHLTTAGGGFTYSAAGNLLTDGGACGGGNCYTYDPFGNLMYNYGATYSYDAMGLRTEAISTMSAQQDYANGAVRDTYSGGWTTVDGGVFTYDLSGSGSVFNREDNNGTPKVTTNYNGIQVRSEKTDPFGDNFSFTGPRTDQLGFDAGDYDSDGNGNHFGAREYAPVHGQWLSPDPAGMASVDPTNPQTWNRYAYVTDNPVSMVDPSGLGPCGNTPCRNAGKNNITTFWDAFELTSIPVFGETFGVISNQLIYVGMIPVVDVGMYIDALSYAWYSPLLGDAFDLIGSTQISEGSANPANNGGWWGTFASTFFSGVLHGVRQPGQSFLQCVNQNANETTGGAVNAVSTQAVGAALALGGAIGVTATVSGAGGVSTSAFSQVSGTSLPTISMAQQFGSWLALMGGSSLGVAKVAGYVTGGAASGVAASTVAVAGGVSGLAIGSAINCR